METIKLERTRKGLPALWERGGGMTNTGDAVIIAGADGRPLAPIYIRRKGPLAGLEHALFVAKTWFLVVQAKHHREDFTIRILRIMRIKDDEAEVKEIYSYDQGQWVPEEPTGFVFDAAMAAMEKARCYHCRHVHYMAAMVEE